MPETAREKITEAIDCIDTAIKEKTTPHLAPLLMKLMLSLRNVDSSRLSETNVANLEGARRFIEFLANISPADTRVMAFWNTITARLSYVLSDPSLKAPSEAKKSNHRAIVVHTTATVDSHNPQIVTQGAAAVKPTASIDPRKVFIVHGRNQEAKTALFEFLTAIKLDPMDWEEAVDLAGGGSPHTIKVITEAMKRAKAIVVLMTPDETVQLKPEYFAEGEPSNEKGKSAQSRPNVFYELGMSIALYEQQTVIVKLGIMRPFSDLDGVNVICMNDSPEQRNALADRLQTAGCDVIKRGAHWLKAGRFEDAVNSKTLFDGPANIADHDRLASSVPSAAAKPRQTPSSGSMAEVAKLLRKVQGPVSNPKETWQVVPPNESTARVTVSMYPNASSQKKIRDHIAATSMSDKAKSLLASLATSDRGSLLLLAGDYGLKLNVGSKTINKNPLYRREAIEWKEAVAELLTLGYIEGKKGSGTSFLITKKGYELADKIMAE